MKHHTPTTLYIRNVPEGVKNRFKALCAVQGISMGEGIIRLMKQAISTRELWEEADAQINDKLSTG